ncbi:MAG: hypothetical protein J6B89_03570 [Bacilli bacterium]|nr:hypothetical protein [Bacilli bacterium]
MRELTENEKEAIRRCEYACELLRKQNIPHEVKKKEIGHINLLGYIKDKTTLQPIMSFWARTGKYVFLRIPKGQIKNGDERGINNCILSYKDFIMLENYEEELEII